MPHERKLDPHEIEDALDDLRMIRVTMDRLDSVLRRQLTVGEYARVRSYALPTAYVAMFKQHEYITTDVESLEEVLEKLRDEALEQVRKQEEGLDAEPE